MPPIIGTGKAYQLLGPSKAARPLSSQRRPSSSRTVSPLREHPSPPPHPARRTWGGIEPDTKEVFNAKGFFSPKGMVETCSVSSWMSLSRELFLLTGEARYAKAFENALYNSLLGALDQNGETGVTSPSPTVAATTLTTGHAASPAGNGSGRSFCFSPQHPVSMGLRSICSSQFSLSPGHQAQTTVD